MEFTVLGVGYDPRMSRHTSGLDGRAETSRAIALTYKGHFGQLEDQLSALGDLLDLVGVLLGVIVFFARLFH